MLSNNCNNELLNIPLIVMPEIDQRVFPNRFLLHTTSFQSRAGFYASVIGPLPFNYSAHRFTDQFRIYCYAPDRIGLPDAPTDVETLRVFGKEASQESEEASQEPPDAASLD